MDKKWLALILIIIFFFWHTAHAQYEPAVELELPDYNYTIPAASYLSENDKLWLQRKKNIKVAVYESEQSPLVHSMFAGRYRGVNADYLALIQYSLHLHIQVMGYRDKQTAVNALKAGDVDMVLTGLESLFQYEDSIRHSVPVVNSWPTLVTTLANVMAPLHTVQGVRIATVDNYPDLNFIQQSFPNAEIINYASYQEALNSVVTGQNDYFSGDSLTTSAWLSQEFSMALSTVKYWAAPQKESVFLLLPGQTRLIKIVNTVLSTIDENIHRQIVQSATDKGNLSFLIEPLELTLREKKWLNSHKKLRVIINPWYAPYTMADSNQETRGIVGDILNLISLQTGIEFETVVVKSSEEMASEMKKENWHIIQAATYDLNRENYLSFTHPFITTQFVTIVKKENAKNTVLQVGRRIAISADHPLLPKLKTQYPNIRWEETENSSVALNLVATGKVDAAISNLLTVRYLSEHYYPEQLIWHPLADAEPAAISFAVPRSEPELRQILDKALNDIPQKEILQITSKWIRLPDVKIDTWELYNRPFYLVAVMATLLVGSSLLWSVYLSKEVRQRKRSQRLLEEERNKAQKANKEKRDFLSHMSHEIRTPVSAIVGFLELLQLSPERFSSEDKASVDQAAQASRSLLKLVGEILDLEKIESGLLDIVPQWVNVDVFVAEKIALFNAIAAQNKIELEYNSHLNPRDAMFLDPQLLGQVLINLIGNAVKFTRQGYVHLSAEQQNEILIISVCDSGPGITVEEQSRLFTAFSQGKAGKHHSGSGLGLAICLGLMKNMGGEITLQSEINRGTMVTLSLPVKISRDAMPVPEEIPPSLSVIPEGLHVLIADDHPSSRLLLKRQLAMLNIMADEAENGEEALQYIRQRHYDLLITDLNMPVMGGIELVRQALKFDNALTVWGLTATAQEQERERCHAAGMSACLFKPVNLSQLSQLLSSISVKKDFVFDIERLNILAQGNRVLMLAALKDAQQENRQDLANASQKMLINDYTAVKYHIHRISGTAQILGFRRLIEVTQSLENKLPDAISSTELVIEFGHIDTLLNELDQAIEQFAP